MSKFEGKTRVDIEIYEVDKMTDDIKEYQEK
jgi:hypothetical protein